MDVGTVERAFQLAPECSSLDELRSKLIGEGHFNIEVHLRGSLRKELRQLLSRGGPA